MSPALQSLPHDELPAGLADQAQPLIAAAGTLQFDEGAPCPGFPMALEGSIRVARGSRHGRQLELYRVPPVELCVVLNSCLFGCVPLSAHGQATVATQLVLLGPVGFERWCSHASFRRYVFGVFADRLADLMALTEAVAFQRLAQRPAQAPPGRGALMKTNAGGIDPILRIVLGLAIIALTLTGTISAWGWIGVVPVLTGALAICPLYTMLGFRSCPVKIR